MVVSKEGRRAPVVTAKAKEEGAELLGDHDTWCIFLSDEISKTFPPTTLFWLTHLHHRIMLIITTETNFYTLRVDKKILYYQSLSSQFLQPQLQSSHPYEQLLIAIFAGWRKTF